MAAFGFLTRQGQHLSFSDFFGGGGGAAGLGVGPVAEGLVEYGAPGAAAAVAAGGGGTAGPGGRGRRRKIRKSWERGEWAK